LRAFSHVKNIGVSFCHFLLLLIHTDSCKFGDFFLLLHTLVFLVVKLLFLCQNVSELIGFGLYLLSWMMEAVQKWLF